MALSGCVGSRLNDALLQTIEEAIKNDLSGKLENLLSDYAIPSGEINRKNLLHKATWLGFSKCVAVLLQHGADPNWPHRKNGCTPLHLAHMNTIDGTSPVFTVTALINAGASVNNKGSSKCGKIALDHAIEHQRLDSVQSLIDARCMITFQSVLNAIDIGNPQILKLLLISGGSCGNSLDDTFFWGKALNRVINMPLKCPKEWYKSMFKLLADATVCFPIVRGSLEKDDLLDSYANFHRIKLKNKHHSAIENELKVMASDYVDLTQYLYSFMIRNGYTPNESVKSYMSGLGKIDWINDYISKPATLKDSAVRVLRSCLNRSGNILYGMKMLAVPNRLNDLMMFRY